MGNKTQEANVTKETAKNTTEAAKAKPVAANSTTEVKPKNNT